MEPLSAVMITFAAISLVASWILLIITAANEDFTWGLCSVFLPPLAYFYALFEWRKTADSLKFAGLGIALLALSTF
ncbi:hypothetical protein OAF61_03580 [Pseudomonadales bacterium]|jgi:hypothetical protein|nr:hypothetical protein [Pseudomonadales bacterium]